MVLYTLRINNANISASGLATFTLSESYTIIEAKLVRVSGNGMTAGGESATNLTQDPMLYARLTGFTTDAIQHSGSANLLNTIPLGVLKETESILLDKPLTILRGVEETNTTITIQLFEIIDNTERTTDIPDYFERGASPQTKNTHLDITIDLIESNHSRQSLN